MSQQPKALLDPNNNILNISRKKSSGQFIFLSKIFLKKWEKMELHGLGEATKTVASVAETLQRKGYATIKKIETQTYVPEEKDNQKGQGNKKVKLIAWLEVTEEGKKMIDEDLERKKPQEQRQQQQQPEQQQQQQQEEQAQIQQQ